MNLSAVVLVMLMMLMMRGVTMGLAVMLGGAGIRREINENRGQQGEQNYFFHRIGSETIG